MALALAASARSGADMFRPHAAVMSRRPVWEFAERVQFSDARSRRVSIIWFSRSRLLAVLHQPMPDEARIRLLAFTLAVELASGSVVEAWVSFERLPPWKSASALRPPP